MLWHEQTWPTIASLDKNLPVVIPLGSCEQHGHHLPLFVDSMQVTALAERVEKQMRESMLLTPTLWLGSSHHHKDFAGTISVTPLLYAKVLQDVARSVIGAGFKKIFFLNGHGGNRTPAGDAMSDLVATDDLADDAYLVVASWWEVGVDALDPKKLGMQTPIISHACEYETSFMLAIRPDLVRMQLAKKGSPVMTDKWHHTEELMSQRVGVYRRFHRFTAVGSMGNGTVATEAKGNAILDGVSREVCAFLKDFAKWEALPKIGPQR